MHVDLRSVVALGAAAMLGGCSESPTEPHLPQPLQPVAQADVLDDPLYLDMVQALQKDPGDPVARSMVGIMTAAPGTPPSGEKTR